MGITTIGVPAFSDLESDTLCPAGAAPGRRTYAKAEIEQWLQRVAQRDGGTLGACRR